MTAALHSKQRGKKWVFATREPSSSPVQAVAWAALTRWPSRKKVQMWWCNDIRAEAAAAVADEVKAAGGQAIANTGDITTVAGAQSILDATLAAFGDVNVIVNNAACARATACS